MTWQSGHWRVKLTAEAGPLMPTPRDRSTTPVIIPERASVSLMTLTLCTSMYGSRSPSAPTLK